jgi:hypothetical protein
MIAIVLLASLSACGVVGITPPPGVASPSPAGPTQPGADATMTPAPTPGTPFEVEGMLEVEGNLPNLHFFLRTEEGSRLEVMAWLPVEVMQPPSGQSAPPTMADWVGHKVKLHGQWAQTESGLVFQVISAERAD